MSIKPIVLCIMDGYGLRKETKGNGVALAQKPNIDFLWNRYPHTTLSGSGMDVGLPEGQMGNSEVGHMNLGAGRVVYQSLTLINKRIADGEFYNHDTFLKAVDHVKKNNSTLHVMGLLSDGGVHSHITHLVALVELAARHGVKKLVFHAFMDGRDVNPQNGPLYIRTLLDAFETYGVGAIATIAGRFYAMDRDKNFDRTEKALKAIALGEGNSFVDPVQYVMSQYQTLPASGRDPSDEFIIPGVNSKVDGILRDHDAVIHANFRPDRAIQLATVITNPLFYQVPAKKGDGSLLHAPYTSPFEFHDVLFVGMMKYAESVKGIIAYALPPMTNLLGEVLAERGYRQLRIAETEKYAHVTFFFDGTTNYDGKEQPELPHSKRILVNSPKVATYDLKPEMSAPEVTANVLAELDHQDVIILNYANPDMVGHTANVEAVIKSVETVDDAVGQIYRKIHTLGGAMIIIADHGNAEMLIDDDGNPFTAHTTNPVPFIVTSDDVTVNPNKMGKLGDIGPTILAMLGEEIPAEMDGDVLVQFDK